MSSVFNFSIRVYKMKQFCCKILHVSFVYLFRNVIFPQPTPPLPTKNNVICFIFCAWISPWYGLSARAFSPSLQTLSPCVSEFSMRLFFSRRSYVRYHFKLLKVGSAGSWRLRLRNWIGMKYNKPSGIQIWRRAQIMRKVFSGGLASAEFKIKWYRTE